MEEFDAVVLGLGGIGSGAAYWLAKRGARVLGLEQFELGHARGESHDHSRIIRLSYVTPAYVRLAREAYRAWQTVEEDAREQLVFRTGGLDLGPRGGAIPLTGYADAMRACDVPFERLDAAEIRKRWPAFTIDDDVGGLFQADGGIVAAERATAAHQRAARALGAVLRDRAPVTRLRDAGGEIEIEAGGRHYRAGKLVVTAGPWSARTLAAFGVELPLEVTKEQAMYFRARDLERFALGSFPVWIWMDDPSFYGFPVFGERGAVKVTQDAGGRAVNPDARGFDEDPAITRRVREFPGTASSGGARSSAGGQDVPLHAHARSRFRDRPVARTSERVRRDRRGTRVQVRIGHRPDSQRTRPRRRDAQRNR